MTNAQRRRVSDERNRKASVRAERERREEVARIVKGEKPSAKSGPAAKSNDWLKSQRVPAGTPKGVSSYFTRLKGWLPDGIRPEDMPIVLMLAQSMFLVDHHAKYGNDAGCEDWKDHAAARDRSIANVDRYHKQLHEAVQRRKRDGDGEPDLPDESGKIVVGNF